MNILTEEPFFMLRETLTQIKVLIRHTIRFCVVEQVPLFLHTIGLGRILRKRVTEANFKRSNETVSRYFKMVVHAIGELRDDILRLCLFKFQPKS